MPRAVLLNTIKMYKDNFNIDDLKFTKILLGKNSKNPLYSWTKKENWIFDDINLNNYNYDESYY